MGTSGLEVRVKSLEETQRALLALPDRMATLERHVADVASQIVQLRDEMRSEFSAIRADGAKTHADIAMLRESGAKMREDIATLRESGATMREDIATLREAIAATDRYMRVLHEDVVTRIKAIRHG